VEKGLWCSGTNGGDESARDRATWRTREGGNKVLSNYNTFETDVYTISVYLL
jgi:hypothetical protein